MPGEAATIWLGVTWLMSSSSFSLSSFFTSAFISSANSSPSTILFFTNTWGSSVSISRSAYALSESAGILRASLTPFT